MRSSQSKPMIARLLNFKCHIDEGINRLAIQATNANGRQFSDAVRLTTTLDTVPPRAPTCPDCPVSVEAESTAELVGEKDAEANILSDEDEVVTYTDSTEWSYRVAIRGNQHVYTSFDGQSGKRQ